MLFDDVIGIFFYNKMYLSIRNLRLLLENFWIFFAFHEQFVQHTCFIFYSFKEMWSQINDDLNIVTLSGKNMSVKCTKPAPSKKPTITGNKARARLWLCISSAISRAGTSKDQNVAAVITFVSNKIKQRRLILILLYSIYSGCKSQTPIQKWSLNV